MVKLDATMLTSLTHWVLSRCLTPTCSAMVVLACSIISCVGAQAFSSHTSATNHEPPKDFEEFRSNASAAMVLATVVDVQCISKGVSVFERVVAERIVITVDRVLWRGKQSGSLRVISAGDKCSVQNDPNFRNARSLSLRAFVPEHSYWIVLESDSETDVPHILVSAGVALAQCDPVKYLARYRLEENRALIRARVVSVERVPRLLAASIDRVTLEIHQLVWTSNEPIGEIKGLGSRSELRAALIGGDCYQAALGALIVGNEYWIVLKGNAPGQLTIVLAAIKLSAHYAYADLFERFRVCPNTALMVGRIDSRRPQDAVSSAAEAFDIEIQEVVWANGIQSPLDSLKRSRIVKASNNPRASASERVAPGTLRVDGRYALVLSEGTEREELCIVAAEQLP